jgi:hypothetical protein
MTQAEELALATEFSAKCQPDPQRGEGWFEFSLYGWRIWYGLHGLAGAWVAHVIGCHCKDNLYFESLREAFEHANLKRKCK